MNAPPGLPQKYAKIWHAAVAVIIAVASLIVAITQTTGQAPALNTPTAARLAAAVTREANTTPNPACNPPLGKGTMGVCAPRVPLSPFASPRTIHGLIGIDVSNNNGHCAHFGGLAFGFAKLNEGAGFRDGYAACNAANARAAGVPLGGYDFLRPGRQSPQAECAVFVAVYRAVRLTGPAVEDLEATALGRSGTLAYGAAWARCVHHALPGVTIIEYTGKWFSDPSVGGPAGTLNLWLSAYANGFQLPFGFHSVLIWQFTDGQYGPFPHVGGGDTNVFLGSRAKLASVFHSRPPTPPISKHARGDCRELTVLRGRARDHARRHHKPLLNHRERSRANNLKRALARSHYSCNHGKIARTK
jgi:GH25 family lysozyme M1 (1,4-beta-N-acetylmuramidase)